MNSPFFAQLQQYVMRVISGLIILIMYYTNISWAAYMPINSNTAFNNKMESYNVSAVLTADNKVDIDQYKAYGPPYYAVANLFVTGATYVYYTFSIVYVFIKYWGPLKKAFVGMVINTWKRQSIYTGFSDGQTRMMRRYKEVPEWWVRNSLSLALPLLLPPLSVAHSLDVSCFRLANSTFCGQYSLVFLFGFIISIIAVTAGQRKHLGGRSSLSLESAPCLLSLGLLLSPLPQRASPWARSGRCFLVLSGQATHSRSS